MIERRKLSVFFGRPIFFIKKKVVYDYLGVFNRPPKLNLVVNLVRYLQVTIIRLHEMSF